MQITVQFADSSEKVVTGYLGCPQDLAAYPNQGQVDTSDARWNSYYDGLPVIMQVGLPAPDPAGD